MSGDGAVLVEREVRELIRRRGLDPVRDPDGVRALVSAAIANYDERSVLRAVPPLDDAAAVHKQVVDAAAGLGPLQRYLDDETIEGSCATQRARLQRVDNPSRLHRVGRRGPGRLLREMVYAQRRPRDEPSRAGCLK